MEVLTIADFVVFGAFLVLSTAIGVFFALRDRKKISTDNYFFAGKKSSPFAVGMSMSATYMSAFMMIAVPAEVYMVGTAFWFYVIGLFLAVSIGTIYFVPFFFRLEVSSVYEYLELRFNPATRLLCAFLVTLIMVFYAGMSVYLPALSVSAVTPISLTTSIIVTGVICIFYTTLGGMKAVIWTDMLQSFLMIAGSFAVCLRLYLVVGGPQNLTDSLQRGLRMTATRIDFDITSVLSPFAITLGPATSFLYLVSFTQPFVQRYKSCRTANGARWAMIISIPGIIAIAILGILCGLLMHAYFEGCDPVKSGLLQSYDQGIPYIALQVFREAPGAAGFFIAAIFSASMSTVSSIINSMAMVVLEDFVVKKLPNMSERTKILIGKANVAILGGVTIAIAFLFSSLKSSVLRLFLSVSGAIAGPMFGIFLCGVFLPWVNAVGALCGGAVSFILMAWIAVGATLFKTVSWHSPLPLRIDQCPVGNSTEAAEWFNTSATTSSLENFTTVTEVNQIAYSFDQFVYNIAYFYYTAIASALTIIVALAISAIAGFNSPSEFDPRLFIPLIDSKIFPTRVRRFFRFGVPEMKTDEINMTEINSDAF